MRPAQNPPGSPGNNTCALMTPVPVYLNGTVPVIFRVTPLNTTVGPWSTVFTFWAGANFTWLDQIITVYVNSFFKPSPFLCPRMQTAT